MDEHVGDDPVPLFVLEVTKSCEKCLKKLEQGLLECQGAVSVEVNEEKKEVRVRGNIEPLELIMKTQKAMGEKAKLSYYNKTPSARTYDFESKSNGKEKESSGCKKEEKEDHYKPYVYKEHDPVYYPSSISGKEFFDYFRGVRSETHKRNAARNVESFADEFPDYSRRASQRFNSSVPMRRSAYPPHFY